MEKTSMFGWMVKFEKDERVWLDALYQVFFDRTDAIRYAMRYGDDSSLRVSVVQVQISEEI